MTTKRHGRSRARRTVTRATKDAAASVIGAAMREALKSRKVAQVSDAEWTPSAPKSSGVLWNDHFTEEDKEIYQADFDGLAVEFDMWPSDHTDLNQAARDAAEAQFGPVTAGWILYSIHAVNDAAKAVLPYPI